MKHSILTRLLSLLLALCLMLPFAGCAKPAVPEESGQTKPVSGENLELSSVISADDFDEAFFDYIARRSEKSFMISPLSFRYALGLLLAGAKGNTEAELQKALGIESTEDWTAVCDLFTAFITEYSRETETPEFIGSSSLPARGLCVANSLWKNEDMDFDFVPAYLDYTTEHFSAEHMPFTEATVIPAVNKWVNEKTKGLIPTLLPDDYDPAGLVVILMNALYFKGSWNEPFVPSDHKDFTACDGSTVEKEFIRRMGYYLYYADDETQLVIVPMTGGVYMTFVLGSTDQLAEKTAKATVTYVDITIPKMDLATSLLNGELEDFLYERGVRDAFSSADADFTGMVDDPDISVYVSDILQKTRIKLDENGVEAAAVTAIMEKPTAVYESTPEPVIFMADRPFSFFIYTTAENTTAMMFAGVLSD